MKLTKYPHAFMTLENNDQTLVIDPGMFAPQLPPMTNVVGVVVTHIHGDHWTPENLQTIAKQHPDAVIYAPQEVLDEFKDVDAKTQAVTPNESCEVGKFHLSFFGGDHAVIHESVPCVNVGVLVNDSFYYPGDSLDLPGVSVTTLAVPMSGPWHKLSEAIAFVKAVKPKLVFPAHEALLSEVGKQVNYGYIQKETEAAGAEWKNLKAGESLEI